MSVTERENERRTRQAEGWPELERAFATVMDAASRTSDPSPANLLGMGHGVAAGPDRDYVHTLLNIVNYNLSDAAYWKALATAQRRDEAFTSLTPEQRSAAVSLLDEIRADPVKASRDHADEWARATAGRVLSLPQFELTGAGYRSVYRSIILDSDAAFAHVMRLIAAPPFCDQLRRCELSSCGRFFLFVPDRAGPPPAYCIDNDGQCSKEATRLKTLERVRKFRKKNAPRRPK